MYGPGICMGWVCFGRAGKTWLQEQAFSVDPSVDLKNRDRWCRSLTRRVVFNRGEFLLMLELEVEVV